jgi:hypothetical protein
MKSQGVMAWITPSTELRAQVDNGKTKRPAEIVIIQFKSLRRIIISQF